MILGRFLGLFLPADPETGRTADAEPTLEVQLAQAQRDATTASESARVWQARAEEIQRHFERARDVSVQRLEIITDLNAQLRTVRQRNTELVGQVNGMSADLDQSREDERIARRRADEAETELAGMHLGADPVALLADNKRLRLALEACETRREELRAEVERLEAERAKRGTGRWT